MGRAVDGAKAGLVAGIPYGVVLAITSYATLVSMKQTIINSISIPANSSITAAQAYDIALFIAPFVAIIVALILGLIFGALYGWAFDKIPGRTALTKAIVFGIIIWAVFSLVGGLGDLHYGSAYYVTELVVGLGASLLFGWFLGYFYGRFTKPNEPLVGPA